MTACEHKHSVAAFSQAFIIATLANGGFVILQIVYAYLTNSTSLFADAIHNLGDVLGLVMAWVASRLIQRNPTATTTYGMKKTSILAAFANGTLLIFSCGIIVTSAIYKLFAPEPIQALSVIVVAIIGIIINSSTAAMFWRGQQDLNIRAAYIHLLYDALISVGVVLAAMLLYFTGWLWIDPVMSLIIAIMIIKGTWALFSSSFNLLIDAVPQEISLTQVIDLFKQEPGVRQIHDLHIWALSTQENALSVHLWMPDVILTDDARCRLLHKLRQEYNINHTTIQVERDLQYCDATCSLK